MSRGKILGERYKIGEKIGAGAFGNVYYCVDLATPALVRSEEVEHTQIALNNFKSSPPPTGAASPAGVGLGDGSTQQPPDDEARRSPSSTTRQMPLHTVYYNNKKNNSIVNEGSAAVKAISTSPSPLVGRRGSASGHAPLSADDLLGEKDMRKEGKRRFFDLPHLPSIHGVGGVTHPSLPIPNPVAKIASFLSPLPAVLQRKSTSDFHDLFKKEEEQQQQCENEEQREAAAEGEGGVGQQPQLLLHSISEIDPRILECLLTMGKVPVDIINEIYTEQRAEAFRKHVKERRARRAASRRLRHFNPHDLHTMDIDDESNSDNSSNNTSSSSSTYDGSDVTNSSFSEHSSPSDPHKKPKQDKMITNYDEVTFDDDDDEIDHKVDQKQYPYSPNQPKGVSGGARDGGEVWYRTPEDIPLRPLFVPRVYAVKVLSKIKLRAVEGMEAAFEREVDAMKCVSARQCRHVINLVDVLQSSRNYYLVMDIADQGNLLNVVVKSAGAGRSSASSSHATTGGGGLTVPTMRKYFRQILIGLKTIHDCDIAHRDIKPENLLLDKWREIKISDFGFAAYSPTGRMLTRSCGTPQYTAPELHDDEPCYDGRKVDMWSLGVTLYLMAFGCLPFTDPNHDRLFEKIKRGYYQIPSNLRKPPAPSLLHLLSVLLDTNPNTRWTVHMVGRHPWIHGYDELPASLRKSHVKAIKARYLKMKAAAAFALVGAVECPINTSASTSSTRMAPLVTLSDKKGTKTRKGLLTKPEVQVSVVKNGNKEFDDDEDAESILSGFSSSTAQGGGRFAAKKTTTTAAKFGIAGGKRGGGKGHLPNDEGSEGRGTSHAIAASILHGNRDGGGDDDDAASSHSSANNTLGNALSASKGRVNQASADFLRGGHRGGTAGKGKDTLHRQVKPRLGASYDEMLHRGGITVPHGGLGLALSPNSDMSSTTNRLDHTTAHNQSESGTSPQSQQREEKDRGSADVHDHELTAITHTTIKNDSFLLRADLLALEQFEAETGLDVLRTHGGTAEVDFEQLLGAAAAGTDFADGAALEYLIRHTGGGGFLGKRGIVGSGGGGMTRSASCPDFAGEQHELGDNYVDAVATPLPHREGAAASASGTNQLVSLMVDMLEEGTIIPDTQGRLRLASGITSTQELRELQKLLHERQVQQRAYLIELMQMHRQEDEALNGKVAAGDAEIKMESTETERKSVASSDRAQRSVGSDSPRLIPLVEDDVRDGVTNPNTAANPTSLLPSITSDSICCILAKSSGDSICCPPQGGDFSSDPRSLTFLQRKGSGSGTVACGLTPLAAPNGTCSTQSQSPADYLLREQLLRSQMGSYLSTPEVPSQSYQRFYRAGIVGAGGITTPNGGVGIGVVAGNNSVSSGTTLMTSNMTSLNIGQSYFSTTNANPQHQRTKSSRGAGGGSPYQNDPNAKSNTPNPHSSNRFSSAATARSRSTPNERSTPHNNNNNTSNGPKDKQQVDIEDRVRRGVFRRIGIIHVRIAIHFVTVFVVLFIAGGLRVLFDIDISQWPWPNWVRSLINKLLTPPTAKKSNATTLHARSSQASTGATSAAASTGTTSATPLHGSATTNSGGAGVGAGGQQAGKKSPAVGFAAAVRGGHFAAGTTSYALRSAKEQHSSSSVPPDASPPRTATSYTSNPRKPSTPPPHSADVIATVLETIDTAVHRHQPASCSAIGLSHYERKIRAGDATAVSDQTNTNASSFHPAGEEGFGLCHNPPHNTTPDAALELNNASDIFPAVPPSCRASAVTNPPRSTVMAAENKNEQPLREESGRTNARTPPAAPTPGGEPQTQGNLHSLESSTAGVGGGHDHQHAHHHHHHNAFRRPHHPFGSSANSGSGTGHGGLSRRLLQQHAKVTNTGQLNAAHVVTVGRLSASPNDALLNNNYNTRTSLVGTAIDKGGCSSVAQPSQATNPLASALVGQQGSTVAHSSPPHHQPSLHASPSAATIIVRPFPSASLHMAEFLDQQAGLMREAIAANGIPRLPAVPSVGTVDDLAGGMGFVSFDEAGGSLRADGTKEGSSTTNQQPASDGGLKSPPADSYQLLKLYESAGSAPHHQQLLADPRSDMFPHKSVSANPSVPPTPFTNLTAAFPAASSAFDFALNNELTPGLVKEEGEGDDTRLRAGIASGGGGEEGKIQQASITTVADTITSMAALRSAVVSSGGKPAVPLTALTSPKEVGALGGNTSFHSNSNLPYMYMSTGVAVAEGEKEMDSVRQRVVQRAQQQQDLRPFSPTGLVGDGGGSMLLGIDNSSRLFADDETIQRDGGEARLRLKASLKKVVSAYFGSADGKMYSHDDGLDEMMMNAENAELKNEEVNPHACDTDSHKPEDQAQPCNTTSAHGAKAESTLQQQEVVAGPSPTVLSSLEPSNAAHKLSESELAT